MNCKRQKNIYRWADGELKDAERLEFEKHLSACLICQKEVQALQSLNLLIRTNTVSVEPSLNFDGIFWQKVLQREKESWLSRALHRLDALIPTPSFAQAFAILFMALFVGGTGGFVATANTITPEQMQAKKASVKYLSGFQEFAGVPATSVAASYLRGASERKSS